jgi:hypothetical protein
LVEAGQTSCWRCKLPIEPGTPWELGHRLAISAGGHPYALENIAVEHRRCNRRASLAEAGGNQAAEDAIVAELMEDAQRPAARGDYWWRSRLVNGRMPREGITGPDGHHYPGPSRDW